MLHVQWRLALASVGSGRALGALMAQVMLTDLPVAVFCNIVFFCCGCIMMLIHRPTRLPAYSQIGGPLLAGAVLATAGVLWAKGLQNTGIVRCVLLDHSNICFAGITSLLVAKPVHQTRGNARRAGEFLMLLGYMALLIHIPVSEDENTFISRLVAIVLLIVASVLDAVYENLVSNFKTSIGNIYLAKMWSFFGAALVLYPISMLEFLSEFLFKPTESVFFSKRNVVLALVVSASLYLLPFYVGTYIDKSCPGMRNLAMRVKFVAFAFWTAIVFSSDSKHPLDAEFLHLVPIGAYAFVQTGIILSYMKKYCNVETSFMRRRESSWISIVSLSSLMEGGDSGMLRMGQKTLNRALLGSQVADGHDDIFMMKTEDSRTSSSCCGLLEIGKLLKFLNTSKDSKKIAIFFLINMLFMLQEIVVGLSTNSLGLLSDAGHMFFDSTALLIGIYASYLAGWKADKRFSFGYARFETLCGFVNGVFLIFIAIFIITESFERMTSPPEMSTNGLLTTSVIGFIVNIIGLVFMHDHMHINHNTCNHHGHSHGGSHGHSHSHGSTDDLSHSENMHGVFLHILADALGSFSVIISSLLVKYWEWYFADPLCSFIISILILLSAYPLIHSTFVSLMLHVSSSNIEKFENCLNLIHQQEHVMEICNPNIWCNRGNTHVAALIVVVDTQASPQFVKNQTRDIFATYMPNLSDVTIQVVNRRTLEEIFNANNQRCCLFYDPVARKLSQMQHSTPTRPSIVVVEHSDEIRHRRNSLREHLTSDVAKPSSGSIADRQGRNRRATSMHSQFSAGIDRIEEFDMYSREPRSSHGSQGATGDVMNVV